MRRFAAPALALALPLLTVIAASFSTATPHGAVVTTASTTQLAAEDRVAPEPRGRSVIVAPATAAPTPEPTETPAPATAEPATVPAPPIAVLVQAAAPAPQPCPASFFCYPRLGIAAPIVPYDDCSGTTDVGSAIRELRCVREGIWLAGHAYTAFGRITAFRVGDVVFVRGQRFEITGSSVQRACVAATASIAPLSLQTSLEAVACGRVLVVQGR